MTLQVFREARKTNRIHFKDRSGGDHIADRTMDSWELPEIVKAGRVKEDQINSRHLGVYFGEAGFPVSGYFDLYSSIIF
jgi:hypothetical protein